MICAKFVQAGIYHECKNIRMLLYFLENFKNETKLFPSDYLLFYYIRLPENSANLMGLVDEVKNKKFLEGLENPITGKLPEIISGIKFGPVRNHLFERYINEFKIFENPEFFLNDDFLPISSKTKFRLILEKEVQ